MSSESPSAGSVVVQGLGGFRVTIAGESGPARVFIADGEGRVVMTLPMTLRSPHEVLELEAAPARAPVLITYPGASKHPAGDVAPVSWLNEEGYGLLRVVNASKGILVMPLMGRVRLPHAPVLPRGGRRGPSRASDLWLIVSALSLPAGFTVPDLIAITGLTDRTVRPWLRSLVEAGLIAHDLQGASSGPARRYGFVASQRHLLDSLLQDRWREWRSGTGHPSLRPHYRPFIAQQDWKDIYRRLRQEKLVCFPSGITFLEGGPGCGPRSWISAGGSVPELFLYTTQDDVGVLASRLGISLLADKPEATGVPISTLCVLPGDHPAIRLYRTRRNDAAYVHPWPWGIAALDAFDHEDARVRQAAREAWRQWLGDYDLDAARARGRRG